MRLLITRPKDDAQTLAAALAARRIDSVIEPVIEVADVDGPPPDLSGVQALLVTSANGARAFARRHGGRALPVLAVGDASAAAARGLGFQSVKSATGDVAQLAALVRAELDPANGALLHVAGSDVAGDLQGELGKAGFRYRRAVLYRARTADRLSDDATRALKAGELDGVVLFSPRTAAAFVGLAAAAGLAEHCRGLVAWCLSRAVADAAEGPPWRDVMVAARPDQESLIDAIAAAIVPAIVPAIDPGPPSGPA
jgi:uroporphyrinogen-III synthase